MSYSKTLLLFCVGQLIIQYSYGQKSLQHFREDYTYLEATENFYKIHTVHRTWLEAKRICANEGARLFFPEDQNETDAVITLLNATNPFYSIFIGLSDLVAEGVFETIDGRSINDVYHKWRPFEPNNANDAEDCVEMTRDGSMNDLSCGISKPFLCSKTLVSLQWNQPCNMPFLDYTYNEKIGRCYKFHTKPVNWTDAHALCAAEQSYLAVINSQQEADYLVGLTEQKHKNKTGDFVTGTVFLGFHNQFDDGWTTVKSTSVEDSGYDSWAPGHPDGGARVKCGSMLYNGRLNDIACDKKSFFICEHEIATLATSLDDRLAE